MLTEHRRRQKVERLRTLRRASYGGDSHLGRGAGFPTGLFEMFDELAGLTVGGIDAQHGLVRIFGLSIALLRRTFSPFTKTLTCCRSCPCSFTTRSRKPTCTFQSWFKASRTFAGAPSSGISDCPLVKSVKNPAMLIVIIQVERDLHHAHEINELYNQIEELL